LKRVSDHAPIHAVGMAWIAVDNECNLHYDISVAGISSQFHPLQAYLVDMPMEVYGAPINRRLLEEFAGNHLEGFVLSISSNDLAKLESSVNFLEIVAKGSGNNLLKAKLRPIKVPNSCYPIYSDNDVGIATAPDNSNVPTTETKCFHSNRFYDDGEQWRSSAESCTICTCNNQRVKCDAIKCPPLRCRKEEQVHKKGECCPTCVGKLKVKN
jgi:chordin